MYNYVASVLDIYKEKVLVLDKRTKTKNKNTLSVKKPIDSVLHIFYEKKVFVYIAVIFYPTSFPFFFKRPRVFFPHRRARTLTRRSRQENTKMNVTLYYTRINFFEHTIVYIYEKKKF